MKRIGIVTFHRSHNYGSVLLAYAMVKVLESFGLEARVIDYQHPESRLMYDFVLWNPHKTTRQNIHNIISQGIFGRFRKRRKNFYSFVENNIPLTQKYQKRSDIKEYFDYLVCGSDQIWNPDARDSRDDIYFLDFGEDTVTKFSYAASSGSRRFHSVNKENTRSILSSFKKIGVREQFMKEYIRETFHLESTVNPDPTLLLSSSEWSVLEEKVEHLPQEYLLVYTLEKVEQVMNTAASIGRRLGLPVVHINNASNVRANGKDGADISLFEISPGQFLWLFHHASFIVSNSFHGNAFSIIYRKDFLCPVSDFRDTRIENLHNRVGLEQSRLIRSEDEFSPDNRNIDYKVLEDKIEGFRKEGFDFIKECLQDKE